MHIMLDKSPAEILEYSARHNYPFWQLRTPLTAKKIAGVPYGLDNGCFSEFKEVIWNRLVREAEKDLPMFITTPDVVGCAQRTIELFHIFKRRLFGMPLCLVLQDNIQHTTIPWDSLTAVFVGGTDHFKTSVECMNAVRVAKMLKKHIHVGRINSVQRALYWKDIADSMDGSGVSRHDDRLELVLDAIREPTPQIDLL